MKKSTIYSEITAKTVVHIVAFYGIAEYEILTPDAESSTAGKEGKVLSWPTNSLCPRQKLVML